MILVPYTPAVLHEQTKAWAGGSGALMVDVSGGDSTYWTALNVAWQGTPWHEALAVVEHDMLPAPGVVDRMLACRRPWCSSPYEIANHQMITDGLGVVKYSARLRSRHRELLETVGEICDDGLPAKNWRRLDTRISRTLRALGYRPHLHARSTHLHDYRTRP